MWCGTPASREAPVFLAMRGSSNFPTSTILWAGVRLCRICVLHKANRIRLGPRRNPLDGFPAMVTR